MDLIQSADVLEPFHSTVDGFGVRRLDHLPKNLITQNKTG
jgi:hypothetical protein